MISLLMAGAWRIVSSRIGLAVLAAGILWGWHIHDKRVAVGAAREGFVREFELSAARAELDTMRVRLAAAGEANLALREKVQVAEGEALRWAAELEAYERETEVNSEGIVDTDLLRRLRAR